MIMIMIIPKPEGITSDAFTDGHIKPLSSNDCNSF